MTAVSLSADSRWSEELSAVRSPDASAGSSSPESGKAEYVGTALNMTKPNVMTTNEMMYSVENWGGDTRQRCWEHIQEEKLCSKFSNNGFWQCTVLDGLLFIPLWSFWIKVMVKIRAATISWLKKIIITNYFDNCQCQSLFKLKCQTFAGSSLLNIRMFCFFLIVNKEYLGLGQLAG